MSEMMMAIIEEQYLDDRICAVCGKAIPEAKGVWGHGVLYHQEKCAAVVRSFERDYSRSRKGRLRQGWEIRSKLRAWKRARA